MSQDYLGEFEQMVLLSIMRLEGRAYGLAIRGELETVAGRVPSSGTQMGMGSLVPPTALRAARVW